MTAEGLPFLSRVMAWFRPAIPPEDATPPSLPPLEYVSDARAAEWLRTSITTFWSSVASFLPGRYEAYARVYHPFEYGDGREASGPSWRELSAATGVELSARLRPRSSPSAAGRADRPGSEPCPRC
jgi:hypothetical protein